MFVWLECMNFFGNQGSAIVLLNAVLTFQEASKNYFIGNVGFNGGALQLYGESVLVIGFNASLEFVDNLAMGRGGAIYHSTQDTFQGFPRKCFLRYTNETSYGQFTFRDNKARNETNAIYSNAVTDCVNKALDSVVFCQSNWIYVSSNCIESVSSEPVGFTLPNSTNRFNLFSGIRTVLPVTITNVFGSNVTEEIILSVSTDESDEVSTNPPSGLVSNNTIELNGRENMSSSLYLQTSNLPFVGTEVPYHIQQCPPGFLPSASEDSNRCECVEGAFVQGAVVCNNEDLTSTLFITNCMSQFGRNDSRLVVGSCQLLLGDGLGLTPSIQLPQDPTEVEEAVCGPLNRRGLLCGECKDGYSPSAYSYLFTCTRCDNKITSWAIYIAFQYLPVAILFFLISILNLSLISPASNAFLFISQFSSLSNAFFYFSFVAKYAFGETKGSFIANLYYTVSGIWNLDFFRAYAPLTCLFENQNALYVTFMDFVAAFFPFFLVLLTYFFLILYSKNFRVVVWIWKPMKSCLNKLHSKFKPRTSLVDVFVTFFVLSYMKIVAITFRFLRYVFVYDINGEILEIAYYYDGSIKMFQGIHIPFGILAIITIFTVVLFPPLLLTCYQFKWFQRILEKLHLRTQALITFVEVIQSGFTDGRDGTKDRRFFAGFYFILRIAIFGPATVGPNVLFARIVVPPLGYAVGIIALVVFQPYQNSFYNKLDILLLLNILCITLVLTFLLTLALTGAPATAIAPLLYFIYFLSFLPLAYMAVYVIRWIIVTTNLHKRMCMRFTKPKNEENSVVQKRKAALFLCSTYSVPDRIIQPELYQSLIVYDASPPPAGNNTKSTISGDSSREDNGQRNTSLNRSSYELSTYHSQ